MTFVNFTGVDGQDVHVAVEAITAIRKDQGGTAVYAGRRDFWVIEEPDAVLKAISDAQDEHPPPATPAGTKGSAK